MGYVEQLAQAQKEGQARSLSATYVEWKENGSRIVGRLLNKNAVASSLGGGEYYQYLFDTDDGLVKFALGRATDSEAGALMKRGGVYAVTFGGTEKLKGGRRINRFEIIEVQAPADAVVGGEADIPF